MFTGLVETTGVVRWLKRTDAGTELLVEAGDYGRHLRVGDSLAVNGCCLTLTGRRDTQLSFDLLNETLDKTNLGNLRPDARVNLERALPADGRIGGHFVQGHIDCKAATISYEQRGPDFRLEVSLPPEYAHYAAYKGSISVNGVSLTVAEVLPRSFVIWIIPHTHTVTNLGDLEPRDMVNLEFDILAKYVERMLNREA